MFRERSPYDFYNEVQTEYRLLKERIGKFYQDAFLPISKINICEDEMTAFLKVELRRLKIHRLLGQYPLRELRKVVQFFYYRERGEKVAFRNMNPYVREFLNRQNSDIFINSPFDGKTLHEGLTELLNDRLKIPDSGPKDVFKIWLPKQFERALTNLPEPILLEGGFGKVCRVIGGVFLYSLTGLDGVQSDKVAYDRMKKALKGGFYFGMLYPLIDDVLDHPDILNGNEKKELINLLDHWIVGDFSAVNVLDSFPSMKLLEEILKEFHELLPLEENPHIYRAALMLFFAQIEDGKKSFEKHYSLEELYVPVIIKAAYTRILSAGISGIPVNDHLINHMIEVGLNLQLMDDFRDWITDYKNKQFTPFTYFLLGPANQAMNPFTLYLSTLRIHFANWNDDPFLVKLLMRRLSISIQRFSEENSDETLDEDVWRTIHNNREIGELVRKIYELNFKIFDPDVEFTKPVDQVVNRGK